MQHVVAENRTNGDVVCSEDLVQRSSEMAGQRRGLIEHNPPQAGPSCAGARSNALASGPFSRPQAAR